MQRRTLLALTPAALWAGSLRAEELKEKPGKAGLSLALAIGKRGGKFRALEYRDAQSHFSVVLRNESDGPLRAWREWCSWGYFCLTFVATTADGKEHKIVKGEREWTKNYPDFEEFGPGECIVRDIFFGSADWENFPRSDAKDQTFKLQAFYEVRLDDDATKLGVWTGKLESPALEVRVWGL